MDKYKSLILAIILTLGLFLAYSSVSNAPEREVVLVGRVIDGDTLETDAGEKIRLVNINTPEKNEQGYEEAKAFLSNYENELIALEKLGQDKYQRTLARAYSISRPILYINLELVDNGLAKSFLVQDSEKEEFKEAEKIAIELGKGSWEKSEFFNCLKTKILPEEEIVEIVNSCKNANTQGWKITDESRKKYILEMSSFTKITLYSQEGLDSQTELFWNSKQNVWNNDADSIYIYDKDSNIIHFDSYGY
tara:strand:+ start:157 stop:903 length:747 start_codon:yes stop_codon:yes gene_type:complete